MGTRVTQHPAIESPTEDNIVEVLEQVKESLEIGRTDKRGDPLDQWVTMRDLNAFGLTSVVDTSGVDAGGPGPGFGGDDNPFDLPPDGTGEFLPPFDPNKPRPLPGRPTNVRTVSLWDSIMVKWDWPDDGPTVDWKGAIVWMSTTPDFQAGSFLGYGSVNFYIHEDVGLSGGSNFTARYYWVAWWGVAGSTGGIGNPHEISGIGTQTDWAPYSYQPGVKGDTAIDPEYALRVLQSRITESELYDNLNDRIDLVDFDSEGNQYDTFVQDRILAAAFAANDDIYAAIAEHTEARIVDGQAYGEYNVRIDLNGYIVGFGLSALAQIDQAGLNYGETSTFIVKAQTFAVVYPKPGIDDVIIPFVIGHVDGKSTVGIDGQLVVDGTITAKSIQAQSIGATEINAESVWAGLMTADKIISPTFRTTEWPAVRLEINGQASVNKVFPMWFGHGNTGGQITAESSPAFYFTDDGKLNLSGDLIVAGVGKIFAGRKAETGEFRVEIGGYKNPTLLWAGKGTLSTSDNSENWIFFIDKNGNMKLRGDLEARFVSGEISRTGIFPTSDADDPNRGKGFTHATAPKLDYTDTSKILETDWVIVDTYQLPQSVFQEHLPVFHVDINFYGLGVRAAAVRISWRPSNEPTFRELFRTVADLWNYGGFRSFSASASSKVTGVAYFRVEMCGFDGGRWTSNGPVETSRQIGYVYGIR